MDAIANPNKEKTTIPYLISIPIAEVRGSAVVETVGDEFIFIVEIGRGETAFRRHGQIRQAGRHVTIERTAGKGIATVIEYGFHHKIINPGRASADALPGFRYYLFS